MKPLRHIIPVILLFVALLVVSGCTKKLDSLAENRTYTGGTDYTVTSNMIQPLYGVYSRLNGIGWNIFPLLTVRGDDINKGGLGDQSPLGAAFSRAARRTGAGSFLLHRLCDAESPADRRKRPVSGEHASRVGAGGRFFIF